MLPLAATIIMHNDMSVLVKFSVVLSLLYKLKILQIKKKDCGEQGCYIAAKLMATSKKL